MRASSDTISMKDSYWRIISCFFGDERKSIIDSAKEKIKDRERGDV